MPPPYAHGETVALLKRGPQTGLDRYGNPVYGPDIEIEIPGCALEPAGGEEPVETGRHPVHSRSTLYAAQGVEIRPHDRVRARGRVYEVIGQPSDWRNPYTGTRAGTEAQLKKVDG